MPEVLTTELKSDLEHIYKITGDLLNMMGDNDLKGESESVVKMFDLVKFRLMDIGGTLQKDIFNCDYLITKIRTLET